MTSLETKQRVRIKILPAAIMVAGVALLAAAGFVLFKAQPAQKAQKAATETLTVTVNVPFVTTTPVKHEDVTYAQLAFDSTPTSYPKEAGAPALPFLTELIALPDQAQNVRVSAQAIGGMTVTEGTIVYPVVKQQPVTNKDGKTIGFDPVFYQDKASYDLDQTLPASLVSLDTVGILRSQKLARVTVHPFQYNAKTKTLSQARQLQLTVTYDRNPGIKKQAKKLGTYSRSLKSIVANPDAIALAEQSKATSGSVTRLTQATLRTATNSFDEIIVTHADFFNSQELTDLATYRANADQMAIAIVKTADIYAEFTTGGDDQKIRDFVDYAYHHWSKPPEYLFLVGDYPWLPVHREGGYENEDWFVYMDGPNDVIADLAMGRISVRTVGQIADIKAKIEHYETDDINLPYHQIVEQIQEHTLVADAIGPTNLTIANDPCPRGPGGGGYEIYDKLMKATLVGHTGHGSTIGWDECFYISDMQYLQNEFQTPIIMAFSCNNANIAPCSACFGEALVTQPRTGAVAFYGAADFISTNTPIHYALVGIFDDLEYSLGKAVLFGETRMLEGAIEYQLLGDPALHAFSYRDNDQLPDLAVGSQDVAYDPRENRLTVKVTNLQPVATQNVPIQIRQYTNVHPWDPTYRTNPIATFSGSISVNGNTSATLTLTPSSMPRGDYLFIATIDPNSTLTESFKLNNENGRVINTRPETRVFYRDGTTPISGVSIQPSYGLGGMVTTDNNGLAAFRLDEGVVAHFTAWEVPSSGKGSCAAAISADVVTPTDVTLQRPRPSTLIYRDLQHQVSQGNDAKIWNESHTGQPLCKAFFGGDTFYVPEGIRAIAEVDFQYRSAVLTTPGTFRVCADPNDEACDVTPPTIPANLRRTSNFSLAPATEPVAHRAANGVMVAGVTLTRVEQTPGDGGGGGGSTRRFTLAWNASTDAGSGIAGYRLYSCAGATCTPSTRKELGNVTSFVFTGATTGITLNFEVTAVDKAGNESARSNRLTVAVAL